MSKKQSFSDTSVGRYSLALYELAKESNALDEVEKHSDGNLIVKKDKKKS